MTKSKIRCEICGMMTLVDGETFKSRRSKIGDKYPYLCQKCCNKKNFPSEVMCPKCIDRDICFSLYKDKYKEWLDSINGV